MRDLVLILFLLVASSSVSAEEKHKPLHGGNISPVVMEEDHSQIKKNHLQNGEDPNNKNAHHNAPKYMAELVFGNFQELRLYVYDLNMNALPFSDLPEKIRARAKLKDDSSRGTEINFTKESTYYKGVLPKLKDKTFEIEIEFIYRSQSLHIGFEKT